MRVFAESRFDLPQIHETDVASIVYTSGTTGIPKGVALTHKNFCFDAFSIIEAGLMSRDDNVLGILPLHHTYPFMTTFLTPLFAGATVTYLTTLKGPEIVKTMRECGITIFEGVPQIFDMLLRGIYSKMGKILLKGLFYISGWVREKTGLNLGKILFSKIHKSFGQKFRFFASGGAKLDPDVARGFFSLGFTILEGYGLTETSPVATFNPEKKPKLGSVGLPIPGVEITILNPDKEGIGEIAIKGPIVMKGYYLNPEATEKAIRDGWFMTGDLGYKDTEGYLYITGRLKEVIVLSSGKNLYPEEIEKHYLNTPFVKEICVIGLETRPGVTDSLQAIVVPNFDYLKEQKIANFNEALKWEINSLSLKLPPYKRIKGYRVLTEPLPKTPLGKVRRFMIKELLEEGRKPEVRAISPEDIIFMEEPSSKKILEYLKDISKKEFISLDDNLELDLGLDSLQRVEMVVALEQMLAAKLPEGFGAEVLSVRDVIRKLIEFKSRPEERGEVRGWSEILEAQPDEKDKAKIGLAHGAITRLFVASLLLLLKGILKLIFRLEVKGLENLPPPPYMITPNHTSNMDGFVVAASVPLKTFTDLYFVGFQKYFRNPITSAFARLAHVIPIDPETYLYRAMQLSAFVLKNSKALCLFPEGGRSFDGELMAFKKGVGILSKELSVPLIPTVIKGTFTALPRGARWPKLTRIKITFGKPISLKDMDFLKKPEGIDEYEWIASRLRDEIVKMGRLVSL
ncbi:MAG: AMP-binding protein [Nitrospirae bacterium]|nr:AMP-binding protein [Nitrospirota bacterium]